ncbi:MAG TPA: deoxyguanosinetriphosphate triphosphohydrolase [Burkholderiaceae bacterium]|jgi:dGTPase|nr:deoxyguanosinetriphosphate triphosphohydrolase [Burkholderiaceae bacterium]
MNESRSRYASDPARSRGRRIEEAPAPTRSEFQRDRDRIVHSTAFRRLVYKTQVFLNHEGDLFRTRLTHSLEVAQLGRSVARTLRLDEDLVEAIALAHDLGHTPFGHAGQDALDECMRDHGGFEHNLQSLRVVDTLEARYPEFDGLNLTQETREGILKRCTLAQARAIEAVEPGGVARRFLDGMQPSVEAQLANLADEIAYNTHDVDDGVRSGLIDAAQLDEVALFARSRAEALAEHPRLHALPPRRLLNETLRRMLSQMIYDVIDTTGAAIVAGAVDSHEAVRGAGPLVMFSAGMRQDNVQLKRFLFANLYRHPSVMSTTDRAREVVRELFGVYRDRPAEMSEEFQSEADRPRAVADYIAGMTDRFALREHQRLTGRVLFSG